MCPQKKRSPPSAGSHALVEMPGIEPGSARFDHEYTTSLVVPLLSPGGAPNDGLPSRPADPLLCALSASRAQHPSLFDAQTPWHWGSPEVDVTPFYGVRFSSRSLGGQRESREIWSLGSYWFCPVFTRSRRLGLQPRISLLRRNRSSPGLSLLYHTWRAFSTLALRFSEFGLGAMHLDQHSRRIAPPVTLLRTCIAPQLGIASGRALG